MDTGALIGVLVAYKAWLADQHYRSCGAKLAESYDKDGCRTHITSYMMAHEKLTELVEEEM